MKKERFLFAYVFCNEWILKHTFKSAWLRERSEESRFLEIQICNDKMFLKTIDWEEVKIHHRRNWAFWHNQLSRILQNDTNQKQMQSDMKISKQKCWIQCNMFNQKFLQILLHNLNQIEVQSRTDSVVQARWSKTWADERRRLWASSSSNQKIFQEWRNQNQRWADDWDSPRNVIEKKWDCKIEIQRLSQSEQTMSCAGEVKQIRISLLFWKITEESSRIRTASEREIQDAWYRLHLRLLMTEREVKDIHQRLALTQFQKAGEKNAERLNDSNVKEALLTSRTPFICDEMCVFLTIPTSNNTTYAS